jgi:hypothetical protein
MFHLRSKPLALFLFAGLTLTACGEKEESIEENTVPVADAGPNQGHASNAPVLLSGTGSYDPDGDPLSYQWSFDSVPDDSNLTDMESPFTVNGETDPATSFTPDTQGTYVVSLKVVDGLGLESNPDRMMVEIVAGDAPVSEAGEDIYSDVSELVTMDGSSSYDTLGRDLTYSWSFAQVPPHSSLAMLEASDTVNPTFTPDVSGLYLVALVVNNGLIDSSPDTAVVRVQSSASDSPTAAAGDDIAGEDCTDIVLDGSESTDPNGDPLSYFWDLQSRPATSAATTDFFSARTGESTTFQPDIEGEYVVSLAVHDGSSWSTPDLLTINAAERSYNSPAAVNPGVPMTYDGGDAICEESGYSYICAYCEAQTVTLGEDAVVSDPDRDSVNTEWTVIDGSAAIHDPNSLTTTVVLSGAQPDEPEACTDTEYSFQLSATDCTGAVSAQTVTHTVTCCGYDLSTDASDTSPPTP